MAIRAATSNITYINADNVVHVNANTSASHLSTTVGVFGIYSTLLFIPVKRKRTMTLVTDISVKCKKTVLYCTVPGTVL